MIAGPGSLNGGLGTGGLGPTIAANAAALTKLWTANSRTYRERPDGPMTTILSVQPINVKGPNGAWRPIEGTTIPTEPATASPARAPHIDANLTAGASQDCSLIANKPTESSCTATSDKVGWDGVDTDNTLIQFNIKEALPADANVLNAELGMYLSASSTTNSVSVSAYAALKPWTTSATWNAYDGTHAWTEAGAEKAGSDYTTTNSVLNPSVVGPPGWAHWYPTQITQEWANGTLENHGLVLADTTQRRTNDALTFNSSRAGSNTPYLTISWTPRGQEDPSAYTMQPFPIDESSTMKVNLASGDLFVNSNDLSVTPKAGPPLLVEHNYDSRNTEGGTVNPWYSLSGASVYHDGSFAIGINRYDYEPFILQSNGTFLTPRGIDATLCKINGTTCKGNAVDGSKPVYALTFNHNGNGPLYREGYKMDFGSNGGVWSIADASGNAILWNYEGKLKLKDGEGHTFTRNTTELPGGFEVTSSWVESGGGTREVKYAYNSSGNLETYTDAQGHKTKYVYDEDGELSEVTAPNGAVTKLYYTADSSRRITKIEGAEEDGSKGTWEYKYYEVGKAPAPCTVAQKATVLTETKGNEDPPITYCSNVWDEVEKIAGYPSTGQPGWYTLENEALGESANASINLASGNLFVTSEDLVSEPENQNMAVNRYYNSQATQAQGTLSGRWRWGTGPHVFLVDYGAQVVIHGASGYYVTLTRTPSGAYTAPTEFEGILTKNPDGTYTLENESAPTYHFNNIGVLVTETSQEENSFTVGNRQFAANIALNSLSPALGKAFELTYDATPHVTQTADSASHLRHYEYDTSGRLKTYTNAASEKTQYEYDSGGLLNKITVPGEVVAKITHTNGKVSEISVTRPEEESTTEKFSYQTPTSPCNPATDAAETVVTYTPGEFSEPYCFDSYGQFTGPKTESEEEEAGSGTPEEIAAGTCYEPEVYKDCELAEAPSESTEEDLPKQDYGIADNNWIEFHSVGKKEETEKVFPHSFFNYFEQKPFQELKTVQVRRTIPWNMVLQAKYDDEAPGDSEHTGFDRGAKNLRTDIESWIKRVKELTNDKGEKIGEPVISFERCPAGKQWEDPSVPQSEDARDDKSCEEAPAVVPGKTSAYELAMREFFSRPVLAEVKNFTAWNEPNNTSQPTSTNGKLAGTYWRILDDMCVRKPKEKPATAECHVAAGEFLDSKMPNAMNGQGSKYFWEYVKGTGRPTTLNRWAWHAYSDGASTQQVGNIGRPASWFGRYRHFKEAVDFAMKKSNCVECRRPNIWLTEQGVVFFENNKPKQITVTHTTKGHPAKRVSVFSSRKLAEGILDSYVNRRDMNHRGVQLTHRGQVARFFYYSTLGQPEKFDSGLLEAPELPKGLKLKPKAKPLQPREIFRIYRQKTVHGG